MSAGTGRVTTSKLKQGARVPAREARCLTNIDLANLCNAPAGEAPLLPQRQMPRITWVVSRWHSRARSLTTPHAASVGGRRSGNGRSVRSIASPGFQGKWVISQTLHFSRPSLGSGTRPVLLSGTGRAGSSVSVSPTVPEASSGVDRGRSRKGKAWGTRWQQLVWEGSGLENRHVRSGWGSISKQRFSPSKTPCGL